MPSVQSSCRLTDSRWNWNLHCSSIPPRSRLDFRRSLVSGLPTPRREWVRSRRAGSIPGQQLVIEPTRDCMRSDTLLNWGRKVKWRAGLASYFLVLYSFLSQFVAVQVSLRATNLQRDFISAASLITHDRLCNAVTAPLVTCRWLAN